MNVADQIISDILDAPPSVGIIIASRVLYALREFHATGVEMFIEEGRPGDAAQWAADHAKLDAAMAMIQDIKL